MIWCVQACEGTLGLLCPMRPICFGLLSRGSHMSLLLPTHTYRILPPSQEAAPISKERKVVTIPVPKEQIEEEERARRFSSKGHWELSTAVTTNHLLTVIALANTLMSMNSATFVPEQEKRRKLHRRLSRADSRAFMMSPGEGGGGSGGGSVDSSGALAVIQEVLSQQQAHIKQGWSLLAALHCVLLPDLVRTPDFKRPQVEMLARRWQDRCLEVREAAQALLLAELRRIGPKGRKMVVDEWAVYLPNYGEAFLASTAGPTPPTPQPGQMPQPASGMGGGSPSSVALEASLKPIPAKFPDSWILTIAYICTCNRTQRYNGLRQLPMPSTVCPPPMVGIAKAALPLVPTATPAAAASSCSSQGNPAAKEVLLTSVSMGPKVTPPEVKETSGLADIKASAHQARPQARNTSSQMRARCAAEEAIDTRVPLMPKDRRSFLESAKKNKKLITGPDYGPVT
ncbi:hypothetical protein HPB51_016485 [Rhipicephalus microplus]|uniref:Uncharacterized protein n=1 Tax=Rhipicephalus microplus TaxID=6941 RepID=A0A9J6DPG8_RHIMP|nr:hypothetical protein HPB51_016485 [Rhipicephalus microplus]